VRSRRTETKLPAVRCLQKWTKTIFHIQFRSPC
jgi:hypothetical protein